MGETLAVDSIYIHDNWFHNGFHNTSLNAIIEGSNTFEEVHFYNNVVGNYTHHTISAGNGTGTATFVTRRGASTTVSRIYFYNNVFLYRTGFGIQCPAGIDSLVIAYNTFYLRNSNVTGTASMLHSPTVDVQTDGEAWLYNNLFVEDEIAVGGQAALYEANATMAQWKDIDYNLYYTPAGDGNLIWSVSGTFRYGIDEFSDWVSEQGWDSNSPSPADPVLVDAPNDVSLSVGSPAIGAATPISWITTDYLGNTRDATTPDIGAYEFQQTVFKAGVSGGVILLDASGKPLKY